MRSGALLLILLFSCSSGAGQPLHVAIDHWPPFAYAQQKPYRGMSVEIVEEIARYLDIEVQFYVYPWARLIRSLQTGRADCAGFLAKNSEREAFVVYPELPYYALTSVFYVRRGRRDLIRQYEDLYKVKVGVVADSEYFDPFNHDEKILKTQVNNELQLLNMLNLGRIDVIVGTHPQVQHDIVLNGLQERLEQTVYHPGNTVNLYFACSRKSVIAPEPGEISKAILDMKARGLIDAIAARYLE